MGHSVSIVIPIYNRPSALNRCLRSIAQQECAAEHEIIIVDDGSTQPGAKELARAYGARLIHLTRPHGCGLCKNIGYLAADGDLLLFLDSDIEFVSRTTLSSMVRIITSRKDCGQVGGELILGANGQPKYIFGRNIDLRTGASRCDYVDIKRFDHPDTVVEFDYIPASNLMVRRETVSQLRGFDDAYSSYSGEDKDFGYRVKQLGLRNYVGKDTGALHYFLASGRRRNILLGLYKGQVRFFIRHFGFAATSAMFLREELRLLIQVLRPYARNSITDPDIQEFERHYIQAVLRLQARRVGGRREPLYSAGQLGKAFLWNLLQREGIRQQGSSQLLMSRAASAG